jgi:DNA-binding NarL/FixJ family response regulator
MKIRVLIIEDHPLMQEGLAAALSRDPGITIVGRAGTGAEGMALAVSERPDVAVLDLHLPDMGGVELLERFRADAPEVRTLIVTASEHADTLLQAVAAGAAGYLTKRSATEEIRQAVITVHGGGSVINPALAAHLLREYSLGAEGGGRARPLLTDREREVLRLVAQGYTDKEIATELYVSARTVQNHLASVRTKLGLSRRAELARWATEHAL